MKTLFKSIMSIAVAAMAFSGCTSEPEVSPDKKTFSLTLTAGNTTRTEIGADNKISWSATGETLKVLERIDAATANAFDSKGYTLNAGKASFTVELPVLTGSAFNYITIHPQNAYVTSSNTDLTQIKLIVPELQLPTATSFDPDADILVSKMITTTTQPTSGLNLQFGRVVALGKMQLTNLATENGEEVSDITLTAAGKVVTGRGKFNFETDRLLADQWGYAGQSQDHVTMMYENTAATAAFDAWFTCIPFTIAPSETFTVSVTTTRGTYTRTVTLSSTGELAFQLGNLTRFSVDMTAADFVPTVIDPSIFAITFGTNTATKVNYSSGMNLGVTGSSASSLAFSFSNNTEVLRSTNALSGYDGASGQLAWWSSKAGLSTDTSIMTIEEINLNGKTAFTLTFAAGAGASTMLPSISKDGTNFFPLSQDIATEAGKEGAALLKTANFHLTEALTGTVSIRFSNTGGSGCAVDDIKLLAIDAPQAGSTKIDWLTPPSLSCDPKVLTFAANSGTAGSAPASSQATYTWGGDECTFAATKAAADTWYTLTDNNGTLTIAPEEYTATDADRTGTVTLTVSKGGAVVLTETIAITQLTAGQMVASYVEVTSVDAGEYIIVGESGGKSYYLPNTATTARPVSVEITSIVGNTITSPSADMTWTIAVSGTGFSIKSTADPTQALGTIANNNGLSIGSSYAENVWTLTKVTAKYAWAIKNTTTNRYIAVYAATNWRTYGAEGTNQNGVFRIFKKQ